MKIIISTLSLSLLISGCLQKSMLDESWGKAVLTRECTPQEMNRVQSETLFCTTNTGWNGSFCYGSAIIRNCALKEKKKGSLCVE